MYIYNAKGVTIVHCMKFYESARAMRKTSQENVVIVFSFILNTLFLKTWDV